MMGAPVSSPPNHRVTHRGLTRRIASFFKKNLKVICALAGILIPASVWRHSPPENYTQQLCAVKTALRFFRRVSQE